MSDPETPEDQAARDERVWEVVLGKPETYDVPDFGKGSVTIIFSGDDWGDDDELT